MSELIAKRIKQGISVEQLELLISPIYEYGMRVKKEEQGREEQLLGTDKVLLDSWILSNSVKIIISALDRKRAVFIYLFIYLFLI